MSKIFLFTTTVYDTTESADVVLRFSTTSYNNVDAPGPFFDRVVANSGSSFLTREVFDNGFVFGSASHDYGRVVLNNADGYYDWLDEAACDGREIVIYVGEETDSFLDFEIYFRGRVSQVSVDKLEAVIMFHDDFTRIVDESLCNNFFSGDNVAPDGLEGDEALKDTRMPVAYGKFFNAPAVLVNSSKLIFCIADRGPVTFSEVRDRGAALSVGSARLSLIDLQSVTAPTAGHFDWYPGSSTEPAYIRLGSIPAGQITVDGVAGSGNTAAQIFQRILTERGGVQSSNILSSDITTLDTANNSVLGGWWMGNDSIRAALDFIVGSVGAGYWMKNGEWRVKRVQAPSSASHSFVRLGIDRAGAANESDIIEIQPLLSSRAEGGIPLHHVTIKFKKNYAVQEKNSLAGVSLDSAERFSREWEERFSEDSAVKTLHPLSKEIVFEAAFSEAVDADAEALRRLNLLKTYRRRKVCKVVLSSTANLDLLDSVLVEHDRFGLSNGVNHLITSISSDFMKIESDFVLWG